MKIQNLILAMVLCPMLAVAQKIDESKYLAGAVPQNELGVVVFQNSYEVPGKSKSEIYQALKEYTQNEILKGPNALTQCRFVEQDEDGGLLAARVDENLYFTRKAWVSHKTRIFYAGWCRERVLSLTLSARSFSTPYLPPKPLAASV